MPTYLARVELRGNPTGTDYDNLHEAMQKAGFLRTIEIGGNKYHLPTAEYACFDSRELEITFLRDELEKVITAVYSDFLLLVSKTSDVAGILALIKKA